MPAIVAPLPQFFDTDGKPLQSGAVYIGAANLNPETSPLPVFWDAAYTQPAQQPLRTANGVIVRSGTAAQVYVNGDYSTLVKNTAGVQVFYARTSADYSSGQQIVALREDLNSSAAGEGAALVANQYEAPGAVSLNLHTYIEDDGSYNLMGFVADAHKAAIRDGTSTVDQTAAINAALTAAYVECMSGLYIPRGVYSVDGAPSLTMTGIRLNQGLNIRGAGRYGSRIIRRSGTSPVLTIRSASPTTLHADMNLVISDLGLWGTAKGSDGLALNGVARFVLERLTIRACNRGLSLESSLVGRVKDCYLEDNNIGARTRQVGTAAYANAITFDGGLINFNSERGLDIGQGSGIWICGGIDIERNGTTADTNTGALIVRNTVDDEFGFALVCIDEAWFESNNGRCIDVENTPNLFMSISNTQIISSEAGQAVRVQGARSFTFQNSFAVGSSSVLNVTCDKFTMENSLADVITDNANTSTYIGSASSTAEYVSGFTGAFTATLTGCTTTPTGTVSYIKQGKQVRLIFPDITGTSNTTAATLTGMPVGLRPLVARTVLGVTRDSGTEKVSPLNIGADGVITLNNAFSATFTASGTKGVSALTVDYEI